MVPEYSQIGPAMPGNYIFFSILVSAEALQCFFAFCFCNNFHDPFVMVDCMIGMPFRVVGFVSQIFLLVHHTQDLGKRAQDKLITPNP